MSDNELEIVFEKVVSDSDTSKTQKNIDNDVTCLSSGAISAKIPRVSVVQASKIKSDASEYLKQQIGKLKSKYTKTASEHKRVKQLQIDQPILKWKSVKYAKRITPKNQHHPSENGSSIVHDISSITSIAMPEDAKNSEAFPETSQAPLNGNILSSDFAEPYTCEGSNGSKLTSQSSESFHCLQNNSYIEHNVSPRNSLNEDGKLIDSNETSHDIPINKSSIHNDSSIDTSGGSKNSNTSESLLCVPNCNSRIVHNATSPSESNTQVKVQSSASPSSTQPKITLSYELSKRPNKFSLYGSPAKSPKNSGFFSKAKKTPKSVNKTSPLTFMRNTFSGKHSSDARGVKRKLNFSNSLSEISTSSKNGETLSKNSIGDETESAISTSQVYMLYNDAYLLRQLKLHINVVLEDSNSRSLLNDKEMDIIQEFLDMNSGCQDLYARMHNRKCKWNRLSDIRYESSTEENICILEEKGFVFTDLKNVHLADALDLLKLPDIKGLCKSLGIKSSVQNKKSLNKEVIQYCQLQKTIGFQLQVTSSEEVVKKKIKKILGLCFILSPEPRGLFRRIHLLFNLKFNRNEQSRLGSQDLFEIQFVGTERALYPKCSIDETAKVFTSREDLLKFQIAEDLKMDFFLAVNSKDWNKAETILDIVRSNFISEFDFISEFEETSSRVPACTLPLSLRKFTPGTVYAYTLSEGIDILKKLKKREKAIDDLLLLLDQTTFLPYMRARWYEKLIVLHRTAGQLKEVAKTIRAGMSDPHVDDQGSYVMSCRSRELLKKKLKGVEKEIKLMLIDIDLFPDLECVERTEIRACALDGKAGYKRVYIQDDETGDGKKFSSVEEFVKSHYCPRMFKHGMHAENSLVSSLFGILFWDMIYEYHVPCAFISPFQSRPLDLSTGEFYKNRQNAIDTKLAKMAKWTDGDVSSWVADIYNKHNGKSSVVYWKWFSNSTDIVNIINCIGLEVLLKICERYAKKYRGVRSGFPDLFLWSPGSRNQYKFVEVKGPKDTLGTNQKLWLDFLVKINANVEVCSVVAQGSKTIKASNALELNSNNGADVEEV